MQNISVGWEFPGGPVVRILGFCCHGQGSIPSQGTEIPQAAWHGIHTHTHISLSLSHTHTHTHTYTYKYIYL